MTRRFTTILALILALCFLQGQAIAAEGIDAVTAKVKEMKNKALEEAPSVTVEEFKKRLDAQEEFFEIVDVREPDEYAAGHIANAVFAPRGKVEWAVPAKITDPDVTIYVYCKAGARGAFATLRLLEMGYKNVINISGGFKAWAKAGYPYYNMHGESTVTKDGFGKKPQ